MCVLVLFPVLVYFVRQSSLLFPLPCLSKTSWSRGQAGVDLRPYFCNGFYIQQSPYEPFLVLRSYFCSNVVLTASLPLKSLCVWSQTQQVTLTCNIRCHW